MGKILFALFFLSAMTVQAQPKLKGGLESFVMSNKIYPSYSLFNCIQGMVTIGFKLNKAGKVYYSEIRSGVGTDLDDEALRLIRLSSGKWEVPAGHDTTVVLIAPMIFELSGCENRTQQEIQQAIANYRSNEGLTNAVVNFFKNKASGGTYKPEEERKILALKKELGYDDEYLTSRIEDGKRKLKQGDKQGACEDFNFVKHMGSDLADSLIARYCN